MSHNYTYNEEDGMVFFFLAPVLHRTGPSLGKNEGLSDVHVAMDLGRQKRQG